MIDLPNPELPIEKQDELILLAMLVWGESRGESDDAKLAVANVVRNRVLAGIYGGDSWYSVILSPEQFSCFNSNERSKLLEPLKWDSEKTWESCYNVAYSVYLGTAKDNTMYDGKRATHYYSGERVPYWSSSMWPVVDIGPFKFFCDPRAFYSSSVSEDALGG